MQVKKIKIFVSSPNDVQSERELLQEIIKDLNQGQGDRDGFYLDLWRWEERTPPLIGDRPQALINRDIGHYDIFIGIMGSRFGTPTGEYGSGTEEEFRRAYDTLQQGQELPILFYFRNTPISFLDLDHEQLGQISKVLDFKRSLEAMGLVKKYQGREEFYRLVYRHLQSLIPRFLESNGDQPPGENPVSAEKAARDPLREPGQFSAFIAYARDGLEPHCAQLAQKLKAEGMEVYRPGADAELTREMIATAHVRIHLLDGTCEPEVEEQLESASPPWQKRLLWLSSKFVLSENDPDPYRQKLCALEKSEGNFELMRDRNFPMRDIVDQVLEMRNIWIESRKNGRDRRIFFTIKDRDLISASDLFTFLRENDIEPLINRQNPEGPTLREFEEKVSKSRAFVVFYGAFADDEWVQSRLDEAMKLKYAKKYWIKMFAVYLAKMGPVRLRLPYKPILIDNAAGFDSTKLRDLITIFEPEEAGTLS